jgi:hypothetical protein
MGSFTVGQSLHVQFASENLGLSDTAAKMLQAAIDIQCVPNSSVCNTGELIKIDLFFYPVFYCI